MSQYQCADCGNNQEFVVPYQEYFLVDGNGKHLREHPDLTAEYDWDNMWCSKCDSRDMLYGKDEIDAQV